MANFSFKGIDNSIEIFKGDKPFSKDNGFDLWQCLKDLSDGILDTIINTKTLNTSQVIISPNGAIDGVNKLFYLTSTPNDSFIMGFKNGLLLKQNTDFTVKDTLIKFAVAPAALSVILFVYNVRNS